MNSTKPAIMSPRGWQIEAIDSFLDKPSAPFILEATPGAGKTIFSALCAKSLFDQKAIDLAIVVVPTTALKGIAGGPLRRGTGFMQDWADCGLELIPNFDSPYFPSDNYHAVAVTYQQLPNILETFRVWVEKHGKRLMLVADEVHHASESNKWGQALERISGICVRTIGMTGTPFRGDEYRISFVNYNSDGVAVPDHRYSYEDAVKDNVCRKLIFKTEDPEVNYEVNGVDKLMRCSDARDDKSVSEVSQCAFDVNYPFATIMMTDAHEILENYRKAYPNAGGIVICRPGGSSPDNKHLHEVARLLANVTGETPEVITHDDPDADTKIVNFVANGSKKWICAVRKVSEGIDIKRLRVCLMMSAPSTELLFRQIVGRVVRVDDPSDDNQNATVIIAKFPRLDTWASRIKAEAEAGIKSRKDKSGSDDVQGPERERPLFISKGAEATDGGGWITHDGERFTKAEKICADYAIAENPAMASIGPWAWIKFQRCTGFDFDAQIPEIPIAFRQKPDLFSGLSEPLAVRQKRAYDRMNLTYRKCVYETWQSKYPGMNPPEIAYQNVARKLAKVAGLRDMKSARTSGTLEQIEIMEKEAISMIKEARDYGMPVR